MQRTNHDRHVNNNNNNNHNNDENNHNNNNNNNNNNNDLDEMTVKILAKRYEELYRVAQDTTLESMETLGNFDTELEKMDDLKTKLLFSIIVLAFRVTFRHRVELWTRVRVMLQVRVD